jgi:hypothetical protein
VGQFSTAVDNAVAGLICVAAGAAVCCQHPACMLFLGFFF